MEKLTRVYLCSCGWEGEEQADLYRHLRDGHDGLLLPNFRAHDRSRTSTCLMHAYGPGNSMDARKYPAGKDVDVTVVNHATWGREEPVTPARLLEVYHELQRVTGTNAQ